MYQLLKLTKNNNITCDIFSNKRKIAILYVFMNKAFFEKVNYFLMKLIFKLLHHYVSTKKPTLSCSD